MTLIAAGQNTRNRALQALQVMSQEEAEREALLAQMEQAKAAQDAQLAGTGLGIAGSYAAMNPDKVTALGQKLGILSAPPAEATITGNFTPITTGQLQQSLAATPYGSQVGGVTGTLKAGTLDAGVQNALSAPVGQSQFLQTGAGLNASSLGSGASSVAADVATSKGALSKVGVSAADIAAAKAAGTTGAGAAGAGAGAAGAGAAGAGAAGAGAAGAGVGATTAGAASTAAAGTAAGAAGSTAGLMAMAAPLAIGLGAFFLLNKLFD